MTNAIPQSLKDALRSQKIIPFVGAGVSRGITRSTVEEPLFPDWPSLLNEAADRVDDEGRTEDARTIRHFLSQRRMLEAAQEARKALTHSVWLAFLKERFDISAAESNSDSWSVPAAIWRLGSKLILTTNFDRVLSWTCPEPKELRIWDADCAEEFAAALRNGIKSPTIWHLHGRVDRAGTVALTADDFRSLYGEKNDYPGQIQMLANLISGRSLLFIGYGLGDEDFTAEISQVAKDFGAANGPHFALFRRGTDVKHLPPTVIPVFYSDYGTPFVQFMDSLVDIAQKGSGVSTSLPLPYFHVMESQQDGLYLYGGRGDKYLEMYDQSVANATEALDVFALSLNRFRATHGAQLIKLARRIKIRIALLDPQFPLPQELVSVAAIREREEQISPGDIRRSVAGWYERVWQPYLKSIEGMPPTADGPGLFMKLYRVLPTVNLFRADRRIFVGPYLMAIQDRKTPSMVFDAVPNATRHLGTQLFKTYHQHFDAIWNSPETRSFDAIGADEVSTWRTGQLFGS